MANTVVRGANRIMFMSPSGLADQNEHRMAFQTSHEKSSTREADTIITKDGTQRSPSEVVVEYSLTTLMAAGDLVRERLENAFLAERPEPITFWDVDITAPAGAPNTYPAREFQGYITDWSESAGAEDAVEISLTAAMNGTGEIGTVTLDAGKTRVTAFA